MSSSRVITGTNIIEKDNAQVPIITYHTETTERAVDIGGGLGVPVTVVNAVDYTVLPTDVLVVFKGSTGSKTITLPAVADYVNRLFIVKNRASETVAVAAATNTIYDTAAASSVNVTAGSTARFLSDGTYWLTV